MKNANKGPAQASTDIEMCPADLQSVPGFSILDKP